MAETERGLLADTSEETLAGEHQFLARLSLGILVIAAIGWGYNLHSRHLVEAPAEAILMTESGELNQQQARTLFEDMRAPHFLTNVFEADSPIQESEPVFGRLSEEKLLAATAPETIAAEWARITEAGFAIATVRAAFMNPSSAEPDQRREWATTFPGLHRTIQLQRARFSKRKMTRADRNFCKEFGPCLSAYIAQRAPRVARYLSFRRANASETSVTTENLPDAVAHMALWMRAFRLDKLDNDAAIVASDKHLLHKMLELRSAASHTGLLFSTHLTLIGLLIGFFRWIAPRFIPQPTD
jgi:hypothetical protein